MGDGESFAATDECDLRRQKEESGRVPRRLAAITPGLICVYSCLIGVPRYFYLGDSLPLHSPREPEPPDGYVNLTAICKAVEKASRLSQDPAAPRHSKLTLRLT